MGRRKAAVVRKFRSQEHGKEKEMNASNHSSSVATKSKDSRIAAVLRLAPLVMMTVIFTLVSFRYLSDPVHATAAAGISFTSPGGITVARVGFAGFPLSFAILAFTCLISARRRLAGLYMVLTVASVVIAVRTFGILVDHSTESARLLGPEAVLLILSLTAVRFETARLQREGNARAASFKAISG
jgi:hypothetical protein